jgi:hypothetical protein
VRSSRYTVGREGLGQTALAALAASTAHSISVAASEHAAGLAVTTTAAAKTILTPEEEVAYQLRGILQQLKAIVESVSVPTTEGDDGGDSASEFADVCFVHLYLSDIRLFEAANKEYCKWFGRNPPSRSCVAVPLPAGQLVAADALFYCSSYRTLKLGRSSLRQVRNY